MYHCSGSVVASVDTCVLVSDASGTGWSVISPLEYDVRELDVVVIVAVAVVVSAVDNIGSDTPKTSKYSTMSMHYCKQLNKLRAVIKLF